MKIYLVSLLLVISTYASCAVAIGAQAPALKSNSSFNTESGAGIRLEALLGQAVLIDFWATWCGPCVESIPHVQELHDKYKSKGLVVIGHTDTSSQGLPQFIEKHKITYLISVGDDIGKAYGVSGIPQVFLIDPTGKIAWSGHPSSLDEATVATLVKTAKPPGPPAPSFATASAIPAIAKIEQAISSGKVGSGLKSLEKMAEKGDGSASAATASKQVVDEWVAKRAARIEELAAAGDMLQAHSLSAVLGEVLQGHDSAKVWKDRAAVIKKDPGYKIGQEFLKLSAATPEQRADKRFEKLLSDFAAKYPDSFYAKQLDSLR